MEHRFHVAYIFPGFTTCYGEKHNLASVGSLVPRMAIMIMPEGVNCPGKLQILAFSGRKPREPQSLVRL